MTVLAEWTEAEDHVRQFLKRRGFRHIQRPDWIAQHPNGHWFSFEVKDKERFEPPPFEGHGLNENQLRSRLALEQERDVRAYLIVRDTELGWILAPFRWLSSGESFLTRNKIRIFPLDRFKRVDGL